MGMVTLKKIPEDFIVDEVTSLKLASQGPFGYCILKKNNLNTLDAVQHIARYVGCKERQIGFAGSKDKHAVTTQWISVPSVYLKKIKNFHEQNISLNFQGYGNQAIGLGDLIGNKFTITVRDPTYLPEPCSFIPNYFDEQRFGSNNLTVGKHIVKKEFGEAAQLTGKPKVLAHLAKRPADGIGALRHLPIRLLRLYVNSYQSWLWNETLAFSITDIEKKVAYSLGTFVFPRNCMDVQVPLIGFLNAPLAAQELLRQQAVTPKDFLIRALPEISAEGGSRAACVAVQEYSLTSAKDELEPSQAKHIVKFTLPKGSYATMVIKKLYGATATAGSGP